MTSLSLTVNGQKVQVDVPPRTNLADFLRDNLRFTGINLGCEQGVCGSCTVLVDGLPVRSCLLPAVSCEGQDVRSIEGLEDDEIINLLRDAFKREHGLQCGFCTPGMLIAARDIVLRVPNADERRIRHELAGNLCRCTGYIGIVNAVDRVVQGRLAAGVKVAPAETIKIAKVADRVRSSQPLPPPLRTREAQSISVAADRAVTRDGWTHFEDSFVIFRPPAEVWKILSNFNLVASRLPGAELTEEGERHVKGRMRVRLGPIRATFAGSANVELDEATSTGRIRGGGAESGSGSRTRAEASFRIQPDSAGSRVSLVVDYNLQGPLAQFSRSGLAQALGRRLVAEFAANLNASASGQPGTPKIAAPSSERSVDVFRLLSDSLKSWFLRLLQKLSRRE
jgi:aerobic carbon-monoxide dehydrogenase small subunit